MSEAGAVLMCGWEASHFVTSAKLNKDNVRHAVTDRDAVFEKQKTDRRKPSAEMTERPTCPPRPGDLASVRGQAGQRLLAAKARPQRRCERTRSKGYPHEGGDAVSTPMIIQFYGIMVSDRVSEERGFRTGAN